MHRFELQSAQPRRADAGSLRRVLDDDGVPAACGYVRQRGLRAHGAGHDLVTFRLIRAAVPLPAGLWRQRTPTSQWTVTGAGAVLLGGGERGIRITAATIGSIVDRGICDANNMGAAMAPAAFATLRAHFDDLHCAPEDYDAIITGDLGRLGSEILHGLLEKDGIRADVQDCGVMIFDTRRQDVHCGGSGCGCSASVLCGPLLSRMERGELRRLLFCGTGALLSPLSTQQGESIPAVCHAVVLERS